ncbi:MAG: hypothetical protein E6I76_20650 [Chloroflexi bacterium]|nr:MAG: hypothetical protein E6I76_20650 [Chloroflexota bacterium]
MPRASAPADAATASAVAAPSARRSKTPSSTAVRRIAVAWTGSWRRRATRRRSCGRPPERVLGDG